MRSAIHLSAVAGHHNNIYPAAVCFRVVEHRVSIAEYLSCQKSLLNDMVFADRTNQ